MRTAISPLALLRPRSLREALRMVRDEDALVPLAGCTDLYVELNAGTLQGARFVDLWRLAELRRIDLRNGTLRIGAMATYTRIRRSRHVQRHVPMLAAASAEIGGAQIQNRGTIGGNIANASPAGDTLPVLAAADAVVIARSADAERRIPFGAFYSGYRKTALETGELIVAVEIPAIEGRQWFRKVGTRAAQAIAKVVIAAVRSDSPRIAIGSVAPTVVRLPHTEALLANGGSIDDAAKLLEEEIQPIDDLRSTAEYRRRVSSNLLRRFWSDTAK
jgi:CO/xanthine dehydrogenase FAD-binding subunit